MRFMWNTTKTTLLMAGLMGLALAIGYAIGGPRAMLIALQPSKDGSRVACFFSMINYIAVSLPCLKL